MERATIAIDLAKSVFEIGISDGRDILVRGSGGWRP